MGHPQLAEAYASYFLSGQGFGSIVEARRFAAAVLGEAVQPGTALAKVVDESVEAAVVRAGQQMVGGSQTTHEAYDRLVDLLQQQPNLSVRSSTSVLQQAYSTPIPIAYLASVLGGINAETTVYEPTAGNGALLIGANPYRVTANELNPDRWAELQTRGFRQLTQADALTYKPETQVDVVICNPPFGVVKDEQRHTRRFPIADTWTTQIDQVIALKALTVMKEGGRAVLILGGKQGREGEHRSERYNSRESRAFYYLLYRHHRVTQHVSIWGDLYRKQGAGFPIDVIVIEGRGQSKRPLPAAEVPAIYTSFTELKELILNEPIHQARFTLDVPVHDQPVSQLSQPLDIGGPGNAIHRQGAATDGTVERSDLLAADANSARQNDSGLHLGNLSDRDAATVSHHPQRIGLGSGDSDTGAGRGAGLGSGVLAAAVGGDLDSEQLAVSGTTRLLRGDLSGNARNPQLSGLPGLAEPPRRDHARGVAERTESVALHPELTMNTPLSTGEAVTSSADTYDVQPRQVAYVPKSKGFSTQTLIPFNMASAAQQALERFEQQHGDIDEYLAIRLGYGSVAELHGYFSAEQVDASALAISNIERGAGFITGDQTGIGKGRICASIMRYAQQQGKIALFITKDKPLYADMMRDVEDIGLRRFTPFITDSGTEIPLANGAALKTAGAAKQQAEMQSMIQQGNLGRYSAVFTTYSQLQTVGKKEPLRRTFLRRMAPNAILILDEAHQAGGSKGGWKEAGPPDRADFVRELIDLSSGVFYSSATYAKRADVMDLYARRTDLRLGVSSMTVLENILTRGGVPLQQIVASKFVASGQMLRRERSYEGISFQAKTVPVDREVADDFSAAMRAIKDFDRAKQKAVKAISNEAKAEAKALGEDGAIGEVGARSTNFTSLMHNCIEQGLLAQKANATVEEAIAALNRGEKPVITVANTMGSFIEAYAESQDLSPGDAISLSFGNLLERYLERSRDVVVTDYRGHSTRLRLSDEQLGGDAVLAYEEALDCIRESDFSSIPISPIDYIEQQLERAGYRVTEVTGRTAGIEYGADGAMAYKVRLGEEKTAKGRIDAVARFNAGDADVILLNCSGSTGISLHASEKFADQRPRHMIVAQAERDINVFMQMLGRVHRTGQVALPNYTLLMGDLPAEKRPGAILCRKMASLNANTTAARETDISLNTVVDFMNPYGEQVVTELLADDPELNAKLDFPAAKAENDASDIALIKKVTGRIPLLPIAEQEAVYSLIESEYCDLVDQARAMGENILEAEQLDLDARPLARMEVMADDSETASEFTGPVYLELVEAKSESKPLTQLQAINAVRESVGLAEVASVDAHDAEDLGATARQQVAATITELEAQTNQYRQAAIAQKQDSKAIEKLNDRIEQQLMHVSGVLEQFVPGTPLRLVTPASKTILYGVVAGADTKKRSGSPAAPNRWKLRILVADSARQITVPFSKFNTGRTGAIDATVQTEDWFGNSVYSLFDMQQEAGRVNRQIFTGNLIKAFEKYSNGKLVNYTDYRGEVCQGLIMPKGFDIESELTKEPVAFKEPQQVFRFLTELTNRQGTVKTLDELLLLKPQQAGDGFILQAPKSKESGGRYYLDEALIVAAGSDFYSVADRMEVVIPSERLERVLGVVMHQRNYTLAAFEFKEVARQLMGVALPTLEKVEIQEVKPPVVSQPVVSAIASQPRLEPESVKSAENLAFPNVPNQPSMGQLEKRILRFLRNAGIEQDVMTSQEFHLRIENEPFIPLVVERQGDELYLTHYLTQNGDMFIDSEMVFRVRGEGHIEFKETAVQSLRGGEARLPDRAFAQIFSKNIVQQGFAEAVQAQLQAKAKPEVASQEAEDERSPMPSDMRQYLAVKDQYPDAIVLVQSPDQRFYEAFFDGARPLIEHLEMIGTSMESGVKELGRVPVAGFPMGSLHKYLGRLTQQGEVVIVDGEGAIAVHPHQPPTLVVEEPPQPEPVTVVTASATEEPEFKVQSLFDVEPFRTGQHAGQGLRPSPELLWQQEQAAAIPVQKAPSPDPPQPRSTNPVQGPTLQKVADEVRGADLEDVAAHLGLECDRHDKHKWRNGDHIVSISGPLFMDWLADAGGRGAIDLVMHVQGVEFKEAVEWLSGRDFSQRPAQVSSTAQAKDSEPRALEMPRNSSIRWNAVREYLVEGRNLPAVLVDRLNERGLIFADDHQNAVFLRHQLQAQTWGRGEVIGASLRGTWGEENHFHGLAPGSARDQGWFWIGTGQGPVSRVLLVESPIDAMSLAMLDRAQRGPEGVSIYLSTDGSGGVPVEALKTVLRNGGLVAAAFDADVAGETMAWRVAQQVPGIERLTPNQGKDWNEVLVRPEEGGNGWQQSRPELGQLWGWHGAAVVLRRPEGYLSRITEVARDVAKGNPLSEKAKAAMHRDLGSVSNSLIPKGRVSVSPTANRATRFDLGR
ncbi:MULTISPECIES: strawberry notch C-terminal domain-containing protein [Cyanophyceae]|uniref:Strawberry notch C-terminal domain-containing protein n=1 Tax=Leptolyngbya subtilissima DQ-A4 TaxID=2933933 RepID=A0ABV0K9Y8_9CYAN|nr:strawberry notch C-terminal domain-containing protein [Nodosilinea sp. FACHB-141]MBD2114974.1 strawberry notch C-terminal domain-containing protein [Nodosilinea sp. FACHB-141]